MREAVCATPSRRRDAPTTALVTSAHKTPGQAARMLASRLWSGIATSITTTSGVSVRASSTPARRSEAALREPARGRRDVAAGRDESLAPARSRPEARVAERRAPASRTRFMRVPPRSVRTARTPRMPSLRGTMVSERATRRHPGNKGAAGSQDSRRWLRVSLIARAKSGPLGSRTSSGPPRCACRACA